jgi:hypothetical protein
MILLLGDVPGIDSGDLLARTSKVTGLPGGRGPLVDARDDATSHPLAQLGDGEKLHVVGPSNGVELAGVGPDGLVDLLARLGWSPSVHLKQIHLIAPSTGREGAGSFAALFEAAIRARGFQVGEIKAPADAVRCDREGKIWVYREITQAWVPSSPDVNYYVGPDVSDKHR